MKNIYDYNILIYANGCNDLEPEITQSINRLLKSDTPNNINILVQLGRESMDSLRILRPSILLDANEHWYGVRRFQIKDKCITNICKLENTNMSHPKELSNFLSYAFENFRAKKNILIISGHSYGYLGVLTDYSQDKPYIMGICDMIKAINYSYPNKIDLLILDTCFMNCIEVLYELSKNEKQVVSNMLTYIKEGPLKGLSYEAIIDVLKNQDAALTLEIPIKEIVATFYLPLIAFRINRGKLNKLKKSISSLSEAYLDSKEDLGFDKILCDFSAARPWHPYLNEYYKLLSQIIIAFNRSNPQNPIVEIFHEKIQDINKIAFYNCFAFAQNNSWNKLLFKDSNLRLAKYPCSFFSY